MPYPWRMLDQGRQQTGGLAPGARRGFRMPRAWRHGFAESYWGSPSAWQSNAAYWGWPGLATFWNPTGYWADPRGKRYGKTFQPHQFVGQLLQTPEAQRYANVSGVATTAGVEAVRQGESRLITQARRAAAAQGLGRGFAQQMETNIRQRGTEAASEALVQAQLEERQRRFELAQMMAQALIDANKMSVARYLMKKQIKAGKHAATMGMLGGLFEGLGSVAGAALMA